MVNSQGKRTVVQIVALDMFRFTFGLIDDEGGVEFTDYLRIGNGMLHAMTPRKAPRTNPSVHAMDKTAQVHARRGIERGRTVWYRTKEGGH